MMLTYPFELNDSHKIIANKLLKLYETNNKRYI